MKYFTSVRSAGIILWWWWFEGGASHEIFTNREGGPTIFLLLPGGIKNLIESFIPFLPHPPPPRELKNDNSLKEMDNFKLQQFNYSRSLITNRGTVERGIGRTAKNYYASLGRET